MTRPSPFRLFQVFIGIFALSIPAFAYPQHAEAVTLAERLSGRIVLQVESKGEAWYIDPVSKQRYYMGRPADAFALMHQLGLGITNTNLARIPAIGETRTGDVTLVNRLAGRILLQVESHGEAWYLSPANKKRYFMGRPADAFTLMRNLGLGISNANLALIPVNANSAPLPISSTTTTCAKLPDPSGDIVRVSTQTALNSLVGSLGSRSNVTVLVSPGTYVLDNPFWISGTNVTFRGSTGNRDDVKILGKSGEQFAWPSHIFEAVADNFTVEDMTIGKVGNHAVQVLGEEPYDADNFHMRNVRVIDTGQQMFKGSYNAAGTSSADDGLIECSLFEYTSGYGPQYYMGGLDVHRGKNWIVKNNVFRNIRSPEEALSDPAIQFKSGAANTVVENNTFINNDRGIGFGLGERTHSGGIIRNNKMYHDTSRGDVGIIMENASNATVESNIILFEHSYLNAIEYRFAGTYGGTIKNNVTNRAITSREGGTATLSGNKTDAKISDYKDPAGGDFTKK